MFTRCGFVSVDVSEESTASIFVTTYNYPTAARASEAPKPIYFSARRTKTQNLI